MMKFLLFLKVEEKVRIRGYRALQESGRVRKAVKWSASAGAPDRLGFESWLHHVKLWDFGQVTLTFFRLRVCEMGMIVIIPTSQGGYERKKKPSSH